MPAAPEEVVKDPAEPKEYPEPYPLTEPEVKPEAVDNQS